ncbi:MAG: 16S rRNA (guanine(527)-N(7))-methyltransferase RsmG [Dysgonamonadaceae bacterium]|nr:16S rRNA (guanine(527)-N(7))-methyltransferase RsmG [Dysgonamonadaceae bacterium]
MELIQHYFPNITEKQFGQFAALYELYLDWNLKINLISRKDVGNLYEHHVLHSLGITAVLRFKDDTRVMDVGTGGGFPGIPLAIYFPKVQFLLIDSVGKKLRAAEDIAAKINLENVRFKHCRVEEVHEKIDFAVSRAVMPLPNLVAVTAKNISHEQRNGLPNGFICFKGGDLQAEIRQYRKKAIVYDLGEYFKEDFFKTKKIIYLPN